MDKEIPVFPANTGRLDSIIRSQQNILALLMNMIREGLPLELSITTLLLKPGKDLQKCGNY